MLNLISLSLSLFLQKEDWVQQLFHILILRPGEPLQVERRRGEPSAGDTHKQGACSIKLKMVNWNWISYPLRTHWETIVLKS